jgi:lysophospholipase L1-like esterase
MSRGLVALGDSITNGEGEAVLGVRYQSWALWLARALDVPFTSYASDGALSDDVVRDQLPRVRDGHDLACLYVGVNDARSLAWDPARLEANLRVLLGALRERAARVAVPTVPLDLGRPPAAGRLEAGGIIRRVAAESGAVVADLDDFGGRRLVMPDAVHPTALGQVEIAERVAAALADAGMAAPQRPWALVEVERRRRRQARYELTYARWLARDLLRRGIERVRGP